MEGGVGVSMKIQLLSQLYKFLENIFLSAEILLSFTLFFLAVVANSSYILFIISVYIIPHEIIGDRYHKIDPELKCG